MFIAVCVVAVGLAANPAQATFTGGVGKIAFQSNKDGNVEIYSINPDRTGLVRLTNNAANDTDPSWSPDGTKIAFASDRDGNLEIYTMNADGTNQTRITNNPSFDEFPSWSPDGTKLVFDSGRDDPVGQIRGEIYTMNADGTNVVRLTNDPNYDFTGVWSPDGSKIAWSTSRGELEIFTMNADGTNKVNVTNDVSRDEFADWSPDGTKIAFITNRLNDVRVWTMNANGSAPVAMVSGVGHYGVSWRPDGKRFAWAADFQTGVLISTSSAETANTDFQGVTSDFATATSEFPDWQPRHNSFARPQGATPMFVSLVPAYKQCTGQNTTHRGAINAPSCSGPTPESSYLTIGSPDFNGAAANSTGSARIALFCNGGAAGETAPCLTTPGDQLDGQVTVKLTDVRCRATGAGCAGGSLTDYGNSLLFDTTFRITDKNNGPSGTGLTANATVVDLPLRFSVPCTATPSASVGSTCSVTTSIDAVMGGNTAVSEQKRAIWQVNGNVNLYDGGTDGVASTLGDDTLFAVNGLFFP